MRVTTSSQMRQEKLDGEWVAGEAAELLTLLAGELDQLLKEEPRPSMIGVDMGEITSIDACGCQLLAVFLGNLERHGLVAKPFCIPAQIEARIRLLGFAEAFSLGETPEGEGR